jgi:hypothetical protein
MNIQKIPNRNKYVFSILGTDLARGTMTFGFEKNGTSR